MNQIWFINHQMADELVDANTVLVVVDTNRPSNTEYPALLDRAKTIVVLDHHRQSSEIIRNATLFLYGTIRFFRM